MIEECEKVDTQVSKVMESLRALLDKLRLQVQTKAFKKMEELMEEANLEKFLKHKA